MIEYGFKKYTEKKLANLIKIEKSVEAEKYNLVLMKFDSDSGLIVVSETREIDLEYISKAKIDIQEVIDELNKELSELANFESDVLALG